MPQKNTLQPSIKHSDEDLVLMLSQKNVNAFSILYDRYAPALFGAICREVNEVSVAEDILEQTFLFMWNNPVVGNRYKNHVLLWMLCIAKKLTSKNSSVKRTI